MTSETKVVTGVVIATIILIIGGLWLSSGKGGSGYVEDTTVVVNKDILIRPETMKRLGTGASSTKVTIVEFADLECPACAVLAPELKKVLDNHKEDIDYYYRSVLIHKGSEEVATYALAAGMQNKFFEFADLVFSNQSSWAYSSNRPAKFEEYARQLGIDAVKLKSDLSSDVIKKILSDDEKDAVALKISSTPTMIINGRVIKGAINAETLEKIIAEEKAKI